MASVTLDAIDKDFDGVPAVRSLSLHIRDGEFLTLLGPSGCGKTTTLRMIAGFIQPTRGRISIGDAEVTRLPPRRRELGMVFQDYALFPHLTVEENIAYGMARRRARRVEIDRRVAELLEMIRLTEIAKRFPSEISGGQQQRVALARAIAHPPRVLLMDEPLGALDLKLREAMQIELHRIQRELGMTTVYVTHDQDEAMILSDRIAVMNHAELIQLGTGEELYNAPRTIFVAQFVGKINLIPSSISCHKANFAIRPERVELHSSAAKLNGKRVIPGMVTGRHFVGNLVRISVEIAPGLSFLVESRPDEYLALDGEHVQLSWRDEDLIRLTDEG